MNQARKYRKKPIIIEAVQWFPGIVIEGLRDYATDPPPYHLRMSHLEPYAVIDTSEGRMKVSSGDWIITGIAGEKYPCKDEIFKATYELVEDACFPPKNFNKNHFRGAENGSS